MAKGDVTNDEDNLLMDNNDEVMDTADLDGGSDLTDLEDALASSCEVQLAPASRIADVDMMDAIEEEGPLGVNEEGSRMDIDKGMAAEGGEGEYGHEYNEECDQGYDGRVEHDQGYNDRECDQGYDDWECDQGYNDQECNQGYNDQECDQGYNDQECDQGYNKERDEGYNEEYDVENDQEMEETTLPEVPTERMGKGMKRPHEILVSVF